MDVLLDLDGTLVDPKPGITASIQYALDKLGLPIPDAELLLHAIGPPLRSTFPTLGVPTDQLERALALYRENYSGAGSGTPAMFDCDVYPGIETELDALRRADCRLIVATSKPHVYARPILREKGLLQFFSAVHGAELDGTHDDKAELIGHIVATEKVEASNAVMAGDRKFDIVGGRKNGLRTIGVTWGYGSIAELREAGASALCDRRQGFHRLVLWMLSGHG